MAPLPHFDRQGFSGSTPGMETPIGACRCKSKALYSTPMPFLELIVEKLCSFENDGSRSKL
jgi:hypothetical protein